MVLNKVTASKLYPKGKNDEIILLTSTTFYLPLSYLTAYHM